jgi:hypothetical protein
MSEPNPILLSKKQNKHSEVFPRKIRLGLLHLVCLLNNIKNIVATVFEFIMLNVK